jgi:hypothetical protein
MGAYFSLAANNRNTACIRRLAPCSAARSRCLSDNPTIKNIPLAFVTGYDKVTALYYPGVPILQKPFSDEELGRSDIRLAHETASKIS